MTLLYLGQISFGNNSKVYRGTLDDKYVAIKVNTRYDTIHLQERFKHEINLLKSLDHENILKYIQHTDNVLVTEIMYTNLRWKIGNDDFDIPKYMLEIAKGLNYLHTLNNCVIHRDIKPENILIKADKIVIGDFGFAVSCPYPETIYISDKSTGSCIYMASELLPHNVVKIYSPESDMWAFGVLCWEMYSKIEPYSHLNSPSEYTNYINSGKRLDVTTIKNASNEPIIELICSCWIGLKDRPSAKKFIDQLTLN